MPYSYFSLNGTILNTDKAVVPLDNIEYAYGFGVYETIRVTKRFPYFLDEHSERLRESARIIGLDHGFSESFVNTSVQELIDRTDADTYNLKILLIGGPTKETANLYIECLNPLFPDRKLYRDGATCITYRYERAFPHAKSLNMLQSYMAYRQATQTGAYDALLINDEGCITEGTRTNFFCLQGKVIISPPEDEILLGVMRKVVLQVAGEAGFTIKQQPIQLADIANYDDAFLTSTSSKIMPIKSIDAQELGPPSDVLKELMAKTDQFLADCKGRF